jgi:hypothetical protein
VIVRKDVARGAHVSKQNLSALRCASMMATVTTRVTNNIRCVTVNWDVQYTMNVMLNGACRL